VLARIDSKGRLYIPKKLREGLGNEVYLVKVGSEIVIVPRPKDPLKKLEELGKKIPDIPIEELKKEIMKQALEEIM